MSQTEFTSAFMLSWSQRQFLFFLADRAARSSINPESEAVKAYWNQLDDLAKQGLMTITDIVGSVRKDMTLTEMGRNLVAALREDAKKVKSLSE